MDEQVKPNEEQPSAWMKFAHEVEKTAIELGKALGRTAEDLTGLVVVPTDKVQREKLDLLVKSGAAQTRGEGLKLLADAGVKAREAMFKRIEATQSQIEALKKGLKGLAGNG